MAVIRLENIEKRFRNRLSTDEPTIALRLDSFEAAEGEQIALTGPSGCGKSTLLNLIAGVIHADAGGVVEVEGQRVDRLSPSEADRFRGQHIGYLFQEFNLIDALSAFDNVLLGLRFGRTVPRIQWRYRAREMLDRIGLGHRRRHRPRELSIGEQQRVAIARALVNHPPIILADEPTGSLDPATGSQVVQLLLDMCNEATHTLLLVTHDMTVADRLQRRFDCAGLIHESDHVQ